MAWSDLESMPFRDEANSTETAYIMINCEAGCENFIANSLRSTSDVKEVLETYGTYDILAKLESKSVEDLRDIIIKKIRKIENVRFTTTVICTKQ